MMRRGRDEKRMYSVKCIDFKNDNCEDEGGKDKRTKDKTRRILIKCT